MRGAYIHTYVSMYVCKLRRKLNSQRVSDVDRNECRSGWYI